MRSRLRVPIGGAAVVVLGAAPLVLSACGPEHRDTASITVTTAPATTAPATTSPAPNASAPTSAPAPTTTGPAAPVVVRTSAGWSAAGLQGQVPAPGTCHYRSAADGYALPDRRCTPGAVDTAVTQGDIENTICRSGYTSTVRPPESLTEPAKYRSMAAYGSPGPAGGYEYDHLVPLELGGSSDQANLWPEPQVGSPSQFDSTDSYGQNAKDGVEDRLNAAVCSGQVGLDAAQQAIAADWTTAERVLGVSP